MSQFWSPFVHRLTPYVPGEQPKIAGLIKLNTNENPYPPSPRVAAAISAELNVGAQGAHLRLYPDPNAEMLKNAVVRHLASDGIGLEQVFVGNGSDEVLAHAFMALFQHEAAVLLPDISYSFYPVYCGLYGIDYACVALDENFAIRVDDYNGGNDNALGKQRAQKLGGIIIANPNAPTGHALPLCDIEQLLDEHPDCVVMIDEAYVDFGATSAVALVARYPNLLVIRTLSKSHALAGLRVGYAVGDAALIDALERVKNSFNSYPLDRLAIVGAAAALDDTAYLEQTRQAVIASREYLCHEMEKLGFSVLPSKANFIFARHTKHDAAQIAAALRANNILVRHFKQARIEQFLRITIGTEAECAALIKALTAIVKR